MTDWNRIAEKINDADAILIGASNGLSITEGLNLFADDAAFENLFGDFKRKYGLQCILHGMGARWPSEEEKWAFWSRLIQRYCRQYQPTQVMKDLKAIVGEKDYFIVTSNGECHFEACGFSPEKIYEVEAPGSPSNAYALVTRRSIPFWIPLRKWQRRSKTVAYLPNCCLAAHAAVGPWPFTSPPVPDLLRISAHGSSTKSFLSGIMERSCLCWNWASVGAIN